MLRRVYRTAVEIDRRASPRIRRGRRRPQRRGDERARDQARQRARSRGRSTRAPPTSTSSPAQASVDGARPRRRRHAPPRDRSAKTLQPAVTSRLKIMGELDIAERRAPQDGRVSIRVGGQPMDLRIAVLPTTYGEQVMLRILHRRGRAARARGARHEPRRRGRRSPRRSQQPYGAVIAGGPTGSGKTTTLYAALDCLNDAERVLTTIEDPVEYQLPGVDQIEVNPTRRPHVRARPAHDPPLRPRRAPRRRDPRRGDGADRDPGGDDRPPRAHARCTRTTPPARSRA